LNLHPSLLPLLRGASPIASAILSGDAETGTTLMRVTATMDAGPILDQEPTPILNGETSGELALRLSVVSAEVLLRDLPRWIHGEIRGQDQDESQATYTKRINKIDANLDWSKPAAQLAREIRAFEPWPGAYTFWHKRRLRVVNSRAAEGAGEAGRVHGIRDGALEIGTGDGILLAQQLQLEGRRTMSPAELAAGHADLIGSVLVREP
jgi:methionyl-tRNA formyltransferase